MPSSVLLSLTFSVVYMLPSEFHLTLPSDKHIYCEKLSDNSQNHHTLRRLWCLFLPYIPFLPCCQTGRLSWPLTPSRSESVLNLQIHIPMQNRFLHIPHNWETSENPIYISQSPESIPLLWIKPFLLRILTKHLTLFLTDIVQCHLDFQLQCHSLLHPRFSHRLKSKNLKIRRQLLLFFSSSSAVPPAICKFLRSFGLQTSHWNHRPFLFIFFILIYAQTTRFEASVQTRWILEASAFPHLQFS